MTDERSSKVFGFREGLLVAGLPVLAYFYDFLYQSGYCDYFGIPRELIVIDASSIVRTVLTLVLSAAGIMAFAILFAVFRINSRKLSSVDLFFITAVLIFLVLSGLAAISVNGLIAVYDKGGQFKPGHDLIFALIAKVLQIFRLFGIAALFGLVAGIAHSLLGKVFPRIAPSKLMDYPTSITAVKRLWTSYNIIAGATVLFLLYGAIGCYFAGVNDARLDRYFLSERVGTTQEIVLRIFSETMLEEALGRNGAIGPDLTILKLSDGARRPFNRIEVVRSDLTAAENRELNVASFVCFALVFLTPVIALTLIRFAGPVRALPELSSG